MQHPTLYAATDSMVHWPVAARLRHQSRSAPAFGSPPDPLGYSSAYSRPYVCGCGGTVQHSGSMQSSGGPCAAQYARARTCPRAHERTSTHPHRHTCAHHANTGACARGHIHASAHARLRTHLRTRAHAHMPGRARARTVTRVALVARIGRLDAVACRRPSHAAHVAQSWHGGLGSPRFFGCPAIGRS